MAVDPFFGAVGAAGVSSAFNLAGGLLSRPNHSQRDLMYIQDDIWRKQMGQRYPLQVSSLRQAGLNPILAVSQPPPAGASAPAPAPYTDPMGQAVSQAGSSALSAFMAMHQKRQIEADTVKKEAEAELTRKQTETEEQRPGSVLAQTARDYAAAQHSSAMTAHEQQRMGKTMIEMAIAKEELTIAEKDAIIAAIDADLYESSIGEVARILQQLGFGGGGRAAAAALLRLFNVGRRKN